MRTDSTTAFWACIVNANVCAMSERPAAIAWVVWLALALVIRHYERRAAGGKEKAK